MPKFSFSLAVICVLLLSSNVQAQLTSKDFKLLLDGKDYTKDSIISIEELRNLKVITGNFPWLIIKNMTFFVDGRSKKERAEHNVICQLGMFAFCGGNIFK